MAKKSASSSSFSALSWLSRPSEFPLQNTCAVFGSEEFLRREVILALKSRVLGTDSSQDFSYTSFDGNLISWSQVLEELSTLPMFGENIRLVVINSADDFTAKNKDFLETYISQPSSTSFLILELHTFAANTRLYKLLNESGTLIDCKPPAETELTAWVLFRAQNSHHFQLTPEAAKLLVEQAGTEMGLLDQELQKLSLVVKTGNVVQPAQIRQLSGSWRQRQAWDLIDYMLTGQTSEALQCLESLLSAGEAPIKLVAAMAASMRRLAAATRIIVSAHKKGTRISLDSALKEAGVNPYFISKTRAQLQRLGSERAEQLLPLLVELDFDLKGDSSLDARLLLERFILRLSAPRNR
ncbi:MAG: DNA polymerase III subunit delta [Planctomycetia bacterium]|nr:DNA polymerase III subunit delta [Planctomycetia bacterium]